MRRPPAIVAWLMAMPSCAGAVVVGVVADPDLAGGLDQRLVERVARLGIGDAQRPLAAAECIVAAALVAFHALEEGQHLAVAPAAVAHLRPGVEVLRLAAHECIAVDGAGAAEQPAARDRQSAAVGAGLGLGGVEPVGRGVLQQLGVADGNARPGVACGARLQQQHLVARVSREPVGNGRAGRSRADDDEVVAVYVARRHVPQPRSAQPCAASRARRRPGPASRSR